MSKNSEQAYKEAKDEYAGIGVDTDLALKELAKIPLSVHCWQGDDVGGFESPDAVLDGGGIQVTGNYPGKARDPGELMADLDEAYRLIPGKHRLSLHAIYGDFGGKKADRDQIEAAHFRGWMDWSREKGIPLDFNGTFFSHPKAAAGFTLSSKDRGIRDFWIEHAKRVRAIACEFGKNQGSASIENLWIPDGLKDSPADRMGYREILKNSLDEIFSVPYPEDLVRDAVETKLFGIGSESFVVGSHEFYMGYAAARNKMICLDMGHFHPTELVADKLSSVLLFFKEVLLHVSRPVRWDSDHVVILNDELLALTQEIVRSRRIPDIHIGLDFFDGTLNRLGAWTTGSRSVQKGLLLGLLEPRDKLADYEAEGNFYGRIALQERLKTMPFGAVWEKFCADNGVPGEEEIFRIVSDYEKNVLLKRD